MKPIKNDRTQGIARIIITIILGINAILTLTGRAIIDVDETSITAFVEYGAGAVAWLWSIWKNFNVTEASLKGQAVIEAEKERTNG